jgi:hypothetical protein
LTLRRDKVLFILDPTGQRQALFGSFGNSIKSAPTDWAWHL